MDVQDILDKKIKALPAGPHNDGLRSVMVHIEAAVRHLVRGQVESDETLFTDVIFRCNQAFEGSIKEAYRVIAGKDPQKKTPAEIEKFLANGNLLKEKVLNQFKIYRQEWRNPSTHDYTLDFDEDEALLAIVSVTVFSIVLCDQISSKLAFDVALAAPVEGVSPEQNNGPLIDLVATKLLSFAAEHVDPLTPTHSPAQDYYRLEGALAGYMSAELESVPNLFVRQEARTARGGLRADLVVARGDEKVVVELKRTTVRHSARTVAMRAVEKLAVHMHEPGVVGGVALIYSADARKYNESPAPGWLNETVRVIVPEYSSDGPS